MSEVLRRSWSRIAAAFSAALEHSSLRENLTSRYAEPRRSYHTLQHLEECLTWFEASAHLAAQPQEVEAALWFHDAVYEPRAPGNEDLSASLAETSLVAAGASHEAARRVAALVLVTKHTALPASPDEQLLVDIDLCILGASAPRFAEYEQQVRAEYEFVPEAVFKQKRSAILRSFLARPRIYGTEFFYSRLEQQARINLARSASAA
ncbi:HD domain-containing protein [Piscinibacter defluvii]|uniref:HD domain-containing protein n=1 Tax=Piscinibacter defluvii TaxID=1796922 RepID=UPI000FDE6376|nr:N-methyl-D-aspartate receptor NMDAR2C subunit [Piscinibacter defluvii]